MYLRITSEHHFRLLLLRAVDGNVVVVAARVWWLAVARPKGKRGA